MHIQRNRERVLVDIPVTVTTVLDSIDATVVDLTEYGAQIIGAALPAGKSFMIDLDGHSVFATVRWSEIDRMGIRFQFPLADGPLYDALELARAAQRMPARMNGGAFGRRASFR
jgi:hypothetical protein